MSEECGEINEGQEGRERRLAIYHAEQTRARLASKTLDALHEMAKRTAAQNRCRDILSPVKYVLVLAGCALDVALWTHSLSFLIICAILGGSCFVFVPPAVRAYCGFYRTPIDCPHCGYRLSLREIPAEAPRFPCPGCTRLIKNERRWSQADLPC